jgi:simple sugar transport system ATP-binding protein
MTMTVAAPIPLLETRHLTKQFGSLVANHNINLTVYGREVHAILGENGAGKSTLMKSLYGFHQPTSGEILLNGQPVTISSPLVGRRLGIGMVFQNFTLIPAMTVLENIALFLPDLGRVVNRRELAKQIREVGDRYDLHVDPHLHVAELAMGQQQRVEILKILLGGARLLIFDEPTSVLTPQEVAGLFQIFDKLKADGYAILFITHKLPEVLATAERITVLRRGAVAGMLTREEANATTIVNLMLGSAPPKPAQRASAAKTCMQPLLEFRNVQVIDERSGIGLKALDLQISPGEIVGVAGVSGNGQRELGEVALGLRALDGGEYLLDGRPAHTWSTRQILQAGVACIPEDPLTMGAIPGMSVAENMILGDQRQSSRYGGLTLDWERVRSNSQRLLNTTFVATAPGLDTLIQTLSGGNLQRVVIARELGRQPRLLLAYYPARGLDISNAEAMRRLLLRYRQEGVGILLISEDLDELFALSDRLLVMYHGKVVGTFQPHETDLQAVGHLMTGGALKETAR